MNVLFWCLSARERNYLSGGMSAMCVCVCVWSHYPGHVDQCVHTWLQTEKSFLLIDLPERDSWKYSYWFREVSLYFWLLWHPPSLTPPLPHPTSLPRFPSASLVTCLLHLPLLLPSLNRGKKRRVMINLEKGCDGAKWSVKCKWRQRLSISACSGGELEPRLRREGGIKRAWGIKTVKGF